MTAAEPGGRTVVAARRPASVTRRPVPAADRPAPERSLPHGRSAGPEVERGTSLRERLAAVLTADAGAPVSPHPDSDLAEHDRTGEGADLGGTRARIVAQARAARKEPGHVTTPPAPAGPIPAGPIPAGAPAAPARVPTPRAASDGLWRPGGELGPATARGDAETAADPRSRRPLTTAARGPPVVMTKLTVTSPADPWEREAEAVAAQVLRGLSPRDVGRSAMAHVHVPSAGRSQLPDEVLEACAGPQAGQALSDSVRTRIEPAVGIDLSNVRVRQDAAAGAAAQALGARAFTSGSTIFLAAQSSPSDVALMAHEATHVAQQTHAPAARSVLMRSVGDFLPDVSVSDVVPDWILDGVRSAVRVMPGYTALSYVIGQDPLTGEAVQFDPAELVDAVLTYGPFGPAVSAVLRGLDIIGDVVDAVSAQFTAHDLTLARISRDLASAWNEVSVTEGIEGNAAILRRYLDAFLRDLRSLVESLVDRVLELVRAAVVAVAEPLLQTPQIAPVWNLAKEVLHYDPLRGVPVQAPTAQIIADFLGLIHQEQRLAQMQERGTLQETADWLDTQLLTFAGLVVDLVALFTDAWAAIQPQNLPSLLDTLPGLADRAFGLVLRVGDFAATLIVKILELVKDALLGWLSENAHRVPGFHLLTVIIGQNPFTGELVPRTATNLIKGFITLLPGGEATYDQLAQAGVISDAAAEIESAMAVLGISMEMVTGLFLGIWDTLSLDDLLQPLPAFGRVIDQFGAPLLRLIEFVAVIIKVVVTLILRLMNFPSELLASVVSHTVQAIEDIKKDPVAFLLHIVEALKLGFIGFFDHIGGYLVDGLVAWLFRGLGQLGITLPTDFSLQSILALVFQVLGLTVEHLWAKLGEHIGEEKVKLIRDSIDTLTGVWSFIVEVQRDGISAIWKFLSDQLGSLWQTLLGMATEWIMKTVVVSATAKLLTFLDPTGIMAVINSCVAIFAAIQSAIDYLRDLLEVLDKYVSTLAAIAAGNVVPGALMLEHGLASIIPIAIGFLAYQVGVGNVPDEIAKIIGRLRELVDKAIDWLIDQALKLGQAVLDALGLGKKPDPEQDPGALAGVDEPVPLGGTVHHLKDDGPSQALALHSSTVLVNSISDPALQALVATYNADKGKSQKARDAAAKAIAAWIAANDPAGGPGGSAPGLGDVGRHGSQSPSILHPDVPLWTLQSEHIIPFTVMRGLWLVLGVQGTAPRSVLGPEDNALTTIMIYQGAAKQKDSLERGRRASVSAQLTALEASYAVQPDHDTLAGDAAIRATVNALLAVERTWYEDLTWTVVQNEHTTPVPPAAGAAPAVPPATHGSRRNEVGALPVLADIQAAAGQELVEANKILDDALAESPIRKPPPPVPPPAAPAPAPAPPAPAPAPAAPAPVPPVPVPV